MRRCFLIKLRKNAGILFLVFYAHLLSMPLAHAVAPTKASVPVVKEKQSGNEKALMIEDVLALLESDRPLVYLSDKEKQLLHTLTTFIEANPRAIYLQQCGKCLKTGHHILAYETFVKACEELVQLLDSSTLRDKKIKNDAHKFIGFLHKLVEQISSRTVRALYKDDQQGNISIRFIRDGEVSVNNVSIIENEFYASCSLQDLIPWKEILI